MKTKIPLLVAIGAVSVGVAACHHHDEDNGSTGTTSQNLDTVQVLALAQQSSETSSPFAVNGGALTLTDTSETSSPVSINAQ